MADHATVSAVGFPLFATRPGKIIGVHLSYSSRATQRGTRPRFPSYFLKPTSSLASDGDHVELPSGAELLAFEGEMALIIGSPARWVSRAEAWSHVASVTAANDFGLYDLRRNDAGSNLRAKGRDGYTPIGPRALDARTVDPAALRVRTWLNGELVQEDTSAGMLFPFDQLVADLSQHLTLDPGDVILTGTPAGSSVVAPGDVVEVEVDAPRQGTRATTGRLTTTIARDSREFDPGLGSLPAADDDQRRAAWGTEPLHTPATTPTGLSAELRAKLTAAPVAGLCAELRKLGLDNVCIEGVQSLTRGSKLIGPARTLRFVPNREDLFARYGGGHNAQKALFDSVEDGEVIVIEARGESGSGTLGDILALRAKVRGAAGVITDGGVRDSEAVAGIGLPVFARATHPAVLGRRHVPWDHGLTVACGGATVQPGDIIVADDDGAVVIPPDLVDSVADKALAQDDQDAWVAQQVAAGHGLDGLFPPVGEWEERYRTWQRNR